MEEIKLTINQKDYKELYNFLKSFKNNQYMLDGLTNAVDLYKFSNGNDGESYGYTTPENLKERNWKKMNKEDLLKLREQYLKEVLLYAQDYHPDEVDCGIMRGPDAEWWFVNDGSRLGYISLYANYIKLIDEVLKDK